MSGSGQVYPIDADAFLERLPDGWVLDYPEPFDVLADNRNTDSKLLHRVSIEVSHPNHNHYHPKFYASSWKEHPLPNVGANEERVQTETLEESVDRAVVWAKGENYSTDENQ